MHAGVHIVQLQLGTWISNLYLKSSIVLWLYLYRVTLPTMRSSSPSMWTLVMAREYTITAAVSYTFSILVPSNGWQLCVLLLQGRLCVLLLHGRLCVQLLHRGVCGAAARQAVCAAAARQAVCGAAAARQAVCAAAAW